MSTLKNTESGKSKGKGRERQSLCMPWCEIEHDRLIFYDVCLLEWLNSLPEGAKSYF